MRKKCQVAWFSYKTGNRIKTSSARKALGSWFEQYRTWACQRPKQVLTFGGRGRFRKGIVATVDASPKLKRIIVPGR